MCILDLVSYTDTHYLGYSESQLIDYNTYLRKIYSFLKTSDNENQSIERHIFTSYMAMVF